MDWNPEQYAKFNAAREAPFQDLLALVTRRPGQRVVDLGCGPGNLTRLLADALPDSDVVGLDNSAAMLARAATVARPGLRFEQRSIEDFVATPKAENDTYDLIFSNSALHWINDHERLIPSLLARLAPGGQLVAQLPSDDYNPMRVVFAEAAGWRFKAGTLDIAAYARLLWDHGARDAMTVLEKIYPHVLADADAVLEWGRGTALLPYLERLDAAAQAALIADIRARLKVHFPTAPVFFPFRRTIFAARRA